MPMASKHAATAAQISIIFRDTMAERSKSSVKYQGTGAIASAQVRTSLAPKRHLYPVFAHNPVLQVVRTRHFCCRERSI